VNVTGNDSFNHAVRGEVLMSDPTNEVRPADYLKPGFFRDEPAPRQGTNAFYALVMAQRLKRAGVTATEFYDFCAKLAQKVQPEYAAGSPSDAARQALREAGTQWKDRCGPFSELLTLTADLLTTGRTLAALMLHLDRIEHQLALLWTLGPADNSRGQDAKLTA
jgi:hypothetical protein